MARKNKDGKYILSAGEVGIYTVCPESWRLRVVVGSVRENNAKVKIGEEMHQVWATNHEETAFYTKGMKTLLALITLAISLTYICLMKS